LGKFVDIQSGELSIPFKIVGIYEILGGERYEVIYMPFDTEQLIFKPGGNINIIDLLLENVDSKDESMVFEEDLRQTLSQHLMFDPADHSAVWIYNRIDQYMETQNIVGGITMFVWIIGIGMLIAGVVGVSNIMLITVKERTHEIGIRKAIGATPGSILGLILLESLCITSMFGYIGMLLGIGVSEALCKIFPAESYNPESPSMFLNPSVDIATVVSATMVLIAAGLLAGYFPARKAVIIRPIEAISAK
jgi:putative ABC transport system permease protein